MGGGVECRVAGTLAALHSAAAAGAGRAQPPAPLHASPCACSRIRNTALRAQVSANASGPGLSKEEIKRQMAAGKGAGAAAGGKGGKKRR